MSVDNYIKRRTELEPRSCTTHPNETITLGCTSCHMLVCTDCLPTSTPCDQGRF